MEREQKQNNNTSNLLQSQYKFSTKNSLTMRQEPLRCKNHSGTHFCYDCYSYDICNCCVSAHKDHNCKQYKNWTQAKEQTRETLLNILEQTLRSLKGKENQIQNKDHQIQMIKKKLKQIKESLIEKIHLEFQSIQQKLFSSGTQVESLYQQQLNTFYQHYNFVSQSLRQSLLKIIDGQIQFTTFNSTFIIQSIADKYMPDFNKYRSVLEKDKKYCKDIENHLKQFVRLISNKNGIVIQSTQKYDRFLKQTFQSKKDEVRKQSLMKILNIVSTTKFQLPKKLLQ